MAQTVEAPLSPSRRPRGQGTGPGHRSHREARGGVPEPGALLRRATSGSSRGVGVPPTGLQMTGAGGKDAQGCAAPPRWAGDASSHTVTRSRTDATAHFWLGPPHSGPTGRSRRPVTEAVGGADAQSTHFRKILESAVGNLEETSHPCPRRPSLAPWEGAATSGTRFCTPALRPSRPSSLICLSALPGPFT